MRNRLVAAVAVVALAAGGAIAFTAARDDGDGAARPAPSTSATPSPSASASPTVSPSASPAAVSRARCGAAGARRVVSFRVEVDRGLRTTDVEVARIVRGIVCDARSWIASGRVAFRYDPRGSLLIGVRTPDEAERRCLRLVGLSVRRFYSCGHPREVVLNSDRWFGNSPYFPAPLTAYRQMLVNHEVGHALGLRHIQCSRDGAPAPVMMQQSKGMKAPNGRTCRPNPWPLGLELARLG